MHPSILVIEDDRDIREALVDCLTEEGYRVSSASNGSEGLMRLRSVDATNLIILDLMMPVMNGQEFRKQQLADQNLAKIPVILLTADMMAQTRAEEMQTEAFLRKPIDLEDLLSAVKKAIAQD